MLTGRFRQKLVNNSIEYYQTTGAENLLSTNNLNQLMSHYKDGKGEYWDTFKKDLALAYTKVVPSNDDAGRQMFDTDTIIIKFTKKDYSKLLDIAIKHYNLFGRMVVYMQKNGDALGNPLPEVKI